MIAALVVAQRSADSEPALTLHTAFSVWEFSTLISAGLIWVAAGYVYLVWRVRRDHPVRPWPWARTLSFIAGLGVIAIATESSIGAYDDVLFSMHMWQHLLLLMVAPPLLLLGQPITLVLHATRNPTHTVVKRLVRSKVATVLTCPLVGAPLYVVTVVATHLTGFMNLTLTHPLLHDAEHIMYLGVGYLYFLPLIGREPIKWRLSVPTKFVLLVLAMPVDTFTGVVLSQANRELFPAYAGRRSWGPSLVADIHAGGAVMWIGGDAIMLVLIGSLCVSVLTGRTPLDAGRFLESARANRFDELAASGIGPLPPEAVASDTDEDDDRLDAYNAYLARLADPTSSQPGAPPSESDPSRTR
jgi:cytochrome c oxidase assembly factor CtaG